MTICDEHLIPLSECFDSVDRALQCRHSPAGPRFSFRTRKGVLKIPFYDQRSSKMLALMGQIRADSEVGFDREIQHTGIDPRRQRGREAYFCN
jgi:hypothetical protein